MKFFLLHFSVPLLLLASSPATFEGKVNRPVHEGSKVIDVQPFNGMPDSLVNYVFAEIKKNIPLVEVKKSIPLPQSAYYPARARYRADSLISFLARNTTEGHITIGLTNFDISTTKNKINDWGVMGLGFCPGRSCVASSFRLDKKNLADQLYKVAIHELGHTQGLVHCPVKTCYMRDAEGENRTEEETGFCPKCKTQLISKGWVFMDQ
jgi:archaemetzincin